MSRKRVSCDCGARIVEESDDALVAAVQKHAEEVHGLTMTEEQVLAMAEVVGEPA